MTDVKIFLGIILYMALVTMIVSGITGDAYTMSFIGGKDKLYNLTDANQLGNLSANYGTWSINDSYGLHAVSLATLNPLYFLSGETPYYEASAYFGDELRDLEYTDSYQLKNINKNDSDYIKLKLFTVCSNLESSAQFDKNLLVWALVIKGDKVYFEACDYNFPNDVYYDLGDDVHAYNDDSDFKWNYDTGFIIPSSLNDFTLSCVVDLGESSDSINGVNSNNANINVYIDNNLVYSGSIKPYADGILPLYYNIFLGGGQKQLIKTNSLGIGILSYYHKNNAYDGNNVNLPDISKGLDVTNIAIVILKIMTFSINQNVIPFVWQFIFFGAFDLGGLYIIVALIRGV